MARPARPGVRDALLDATRHELGRAGPAGLRVEDVARRAGVSKGAFYLHFRAREDAVLEVAQRLVGGLEALAERREAAGRRAWAHPAPGPAGLAVRLAAEARAEAELLEHQWRHRRLLPALEGAAGPRCAALLHDFRQRQRARAAGRLRARQAAGQLRADLDPALAADVLQAALDDLARRLAGLRARPDLEGWALATLSLLHHGMLTRGSAIAGAPAPLAPRSPAGRRRPAPRGRGPRPPPDHPPVRPRP